MSVRVPGGYNPAAIAITGGNTAQVSRCALPMVRSNTGTMGNNGAYTAGTAYAKTYAKCFMYFAVNQIATGIAAGWYYAEASSSTVFTVFNNVYTSGMPTLPASKTAFVTTGPGAITGDTTEQGLIVPIAANQLAASGWWRMRARFRNNNSVGSKTHRIRYSDIGGTQVAGSAMTTGTDVELEATAINDGVTGAQDVFGVVTSVGGTAAAAFNALTIDTTAQTKVAATTIIATATDWAVMEWAIFELMTDGT